MVRFDFLVTWVATGAAVFSAAVLALNLTLPKPDAISAVRLPVVAALDASEQAVTNDLDWPALFGVAVQVEAVTATVAIPIINTTYALKGLVTGADGGWAILAGDGSETLIRDGDTLADGSVVTRIDSHGVILDLNGLTTNVSFAAADTPDASVIFGDNEPATIPGPGLSRKAGLKVSEFDKPDMLRMLDRAGMAAQVVAPDAIGAVDVMWSPSDQFDEKLGAQADDLLMKVNGIGGTARRR